MIRAKFQVISITQTEGDKIGRNIKLMPRYDTSIPEDQRFAQATPSGELVMYVNNPAAIEQLPLGKYFYLDFVPVDNEKPQPN